MLHKTTFYNNNIINFTIHCIDPKFEPEFKLISVSVTKYTEDYPGCHNIQF